MKFRKVALLVELAMLITALECTSTKKVNDIELPPNTHFIFVHGFGSGGWSWFKIQTLMKEAGYKVSCPDLKSAGIDPTNATSISTIEEYDEPLFQLLAAASENETIVLVGTSAGGVSLTHMMHTFPGKIHMAIFVAATMLRNGFLTKQDREIGLPNAISQPKCGESTGKAINTSQEKELACLLQKPGPIDALIKTNFTENRSVDKVKRVYIIAMRDLSLDPLKQQAMVDKWPPLAAFYLDSDHAPNLSKHVGLFKLIVGAAALI